MEQQVINSPASTKILTVKEVKSANLFDLAPDFITPADKHNFWEMVYVNNGVIISEAGGKSRELEQGHMVFNRPDSLHSTRCNGKRGAVIFSIIFDCDWEDMSAFDRKIMAVPYEAAQLLRDIIDECGKTYNISVQPLTKRDDAPFGGEQIILNYLEAFLLKIIRSEREIGESGHIGSEISGAHELSGEICRYLKAHLCDKITLDMLSAKFHFGKVYLCDVFKKNVGSTIITYHTDLKISEAKRMLRETDAPITEIADKLGFESASYFTRCFKSRVGYPPQSFRKMLVTNAALKRGK